MQIFQQWLDFLNHSEIIKSNAAIHVNVITLPAVICQYNDTHLIVQCITEERTAQNAYK